MIKNFLKNSHIKFLCDSVRFVMLISLFFVGVSAKADTGYDAPKITTKALKNAEFYFLIDPDTKEVLLEKNADKKVAPSSMTKLMTAYVVFDQIKKGFIRPDQQCFVGKNAWRKPGSTMFLDYGDRVSIDKLLKGLLVVSGNDAAVVLAEATTGSIDNFAYLMNVKARELGMKNSQFKNPHGLSEKGHYMTMRDLALLVSRMYRDFPHYSEYLGIEDFTYGKIKQRNRNPLIKSQYDGILGGKTGHTDAGGYGVAAAAKRQDRRLVAVMNKAEKSSDRAKVIKELFDYGFNKYNKIALFTKGQRVGKVKTWLGEKDEVDVIINQDVAINIPSQISLDTIIVKVKYKGPVYAPIAKGDNIATLWVDINGRKTLKYDLFAKEDVGELHASEKRKKILRYKIKNFLNKFSKNT